MMLTIKQEDISIGGTIETENNEQTSDQILSKIKLEKDCVSVGTLTTVYDEHSAYDVMSKIKLENDCGVTIKTDNSEWVADYIISNIKQEKKIIGDTVSTGNNEEVVDPVLSKVKLENDCGVTIKTDNSEWVTDYIISNIKQENSFIGDTVSTGNNEEVVDPVLSKVKLENDCVDLGSADHSPKDLKPNICQCEMCGWSFKDLNSFHQHMKGMHYEEEQNQGQSSTPEETVSTRVNRKVRVVSCALCGEKYLSQYYLNRHHCDELESKILLIEMNHRHGVVGTVFECSVCSKIYNGRRSWRRHMDIHLGQQKEQCVLCFQRFSDTRDLRLHMKRIHSKECKQNDLMPSHGSGVKQKRGSACVTECLCNVCGMSFRFMTPLRGHMRIHAESHPYMCCHCYQSFRFIEMWTEHTKECNGSPRSVPEKKMQKKNHLESSNLKEKGRSCRRSEFTCKECGKIFKLSKNLLEHERNEHSSDASVQEDKQDQGLGYSKEDAIPGHSFTEHVKMDKEKEQMVHCALCREEFPLHYHPYRHKCYALERKFVSMESDVQSENSLECPFGNVFFTSQSWQRQVHSGQQNYDGPVCEKQCFGSRNVNEQMRTLGDNYAIECEHSPKRLYTRDAVEGCENTHNAPCTCSSPGKTSSCVNDVMKHLVVDHAFSSLGCGKEFKSEASFQQSGVEEHSISPLSPGLQLLPSSALLVSTEEKKYEEKYQCFFCDKDLKTEEKLKSHLRKHTGV